MDDDEFFDGEHEHEEEPTEDVREGEAADRLTQLLDETRSSPRSPSENRTRVFFGRQLEVMFERESFHWVTNRALRGVRPEPVP